MADPLAQQIVATTAALFPSSTVQAPALQPAQTKLHQTTPSAVRSRPSRVSLYDSRPISHQSSSSRTTNPALSSKKRKAHGLSQLETRALVATEEMRGTDHSDDVLNTYKRRRRSQLIEDFTPLPKDIVEEANTRRLRDFSDWYIAYTRLKYVPKRDPEVRDVSDPEDPHYAIQLHGAPETDPSLASPHKWPDHILSKAAVAGLLGLVEHTSREAYENSSMGWHPERKKKNEMWARDMRYLIARKQGHKLPGGKARKREVTRKNCRLYTETTDEMIAGFASYMVTFEDGNPVIYLYELHIDDETKGCGLGSHLLDMVETIGENLGLVKCMLTVFCSNTTAIAWYTKRGYVLDEFSPPNRVLRNGTVKKSDYQIMSKRLRIPRRTGESVP